MNSAELLFRAASSPDIPAIVALVNSAYRGDSGRQGWTTEADWLDGQRTDAEELSRLLAAEDSLVLLGECGGELAASVHLQRQGGAAHLGMLAVNPGLQGRGLGKRLIAEAEARAVRDWRVAAMCMAVLHPREELFAFYARLGYARTGGSQPFPVSEKFGIQKVPGLRLVDLEKRLPATNPL